MTYSFILCKEIAADHKQLDKSTQIAPDITKINVINWQ